MAWIEIHITTSADYAETLSAQLNLLGAVAVTFKDAGDQPIYEPAPDAPRVWNETIVIGLFDSTINSLPIMHYLEQQRTDGVIESFELKHIADEDWVRRSLDQFKPIKFGQRLWICPSWLVPPEPNAVNVILDPGLAFGTGTHPTTALCLEWLDEHIHSQSLVIDYGCGSGILTLAALKLGAKHVLAVDNDPQALEACSNNAKQNGFNSSQLQTFLPNELPEEKADLVVANILAQPLIELAPIISRLVKTKGNIVLSGVLNTQVKQVTDAYAPWFAIQPIVFKEDWSRITGVRNDLS